MDHLMAVASCGLAGAGPLAAVHHGAAVHSRGDTAVGIQGEPAIARGMGRVFGKNRARW